MKSYGHAIVVQLAYYSIGYSNAVITVSWIGKHQTFVVRKNNCPTEQKLTVRVWDFLC